MGLVPRLGAVGWFVGDCDPPVVGLLDKAANVCGWRDPPPRSLQPYRLLEIVLLSLLQPWAQIESAFSKAAPTSCGRPIVRACLGDVSDTQHLKRLSDLSGQYEHRANSSSLSG